MEPVVIRDVVLGDGVPKICVPIVAHTMAQLDEAIDAIDPADCDLVEFRADFYFEDDIPALKKIRHRMGNCPVIFTSRTKEEGGEIEIAEDEYEYLEWRLDEYCWKVIEMADSFRYQDLAEQWGHPPKKKGN